MPRDLRISVCGTPASRYCCHRKVLLFKPIACAAEDAAVLTVCLPCF